MSLNNLALSLHDRFGQLNIPSGLDEAIKIGLHQVALLLAGHSVVDLCQYSCDALIILSTQDPIHVPLDIVRTGVSELSDDLKLLAEEFDSSDYQHKLAGILRKLRRHVVDPALREAKDPVRRKETEQKR
ncbi:hypothetical protein F4604DRAFT_1953875 [Suillus subluteus]|nr:hypothetical protein F4604DRAFT_1953875 [Suillus subluteus]